MKIEWDEEKRQSNLFKHGINFVDAERVLDSDAVYSFPDERYSDDRWIAVGFLEGTVVHIAYKQTNDEAIRIISMRKATGRERKLLFKELTKAVVLDSEVLKVLSPIGDKYE